MLVMLPSELTNTIELFIVYVHRNVNKAIGVRANIHLGGQTEFCPNGFSGGGGGSSRNFPGSIFSGVAEFFPLTAVTDPQFVFFPLTAVTDPKFVLFKHVLGFARIISTLCPNSCRQTARIGGANAPPAPPSRTPMNKAQGAIGQ